MGAFIVPGVFVIMILEVLRLPCSKEPNKRGWGVGGMGSGGWWRVGGSKIWLGGIGYLKMYGFRLVKGGCFPKT